MREGAYADLNVIDQGRLCAGHSRLVHDFPAGTERYVVDAEGYVATLVNGEVLVAGGKHTGALPESVLR